MVLCLISLNSWVSTPIRRTSDPENKIFTSVTKKTTFKWSLDLPSWSKLPMKKLFFLPSTLSCHFPAPKRTTTSLVVDVHFTGVSEGLGVSYLIPFPLQSHCFTPVPWTFSSSLPLHPSSTRISLPQYLEEPPASSLKSSPRLYCKGGPLTLEGEGWRET